MRLKLSQLLFLLILTALVDTKRTRGRSGAVSLWSRKRMGSSGVQVRRHKVKPSPAIKDTNVEQSAQPLASNGDTSILNRKTRQLSKFKQKRDVSSHPGHPGMNNRGGYNSNNTEGYSHMSDHDYGDYSYDELKESSGFSGRQVFRNILNGVFVWYLVSGGVSRPYRVYNFYNQPKQRAEIILSRNVLIWCNKNATNICVPGTTAICTQDRKILCVIAMTLTTPCQDSREMCINRTIACLDANDPLCQNKTNPDNTTTIILPCFANMTLQNGQTSLAPNITPVSEDNKFCIITMAIPDRSNSS